MPAQRRPGAGQDLRPSVLDEVKRYLTDQYFRAASTPCEIDTKVEEVPGNRVKIEDRHQRRQAREDPADQHRRQHAFKEKDILEHASSSKTPNWLSWYKQDDRYSREALSGDLEKLRSYYMDRGYANFEVESTQVAIAPEKDDIFITVNVNEGEVFKV